MFIAGVCHGQSERLIEARKLQSARDYTQALVLIDLELKDDVENGGAWFTYAEVNYAIFEKSTTVKEKKEALQKAIKGYRNTIEFQDPLSRMYAVAKANLSEIQPRLLDEGIVFYNKKSYQQAVEKFVYANIVQPNDTVSLIYGVSAANQGLLYQEAFDFYVKLIEIKPKEQYYQNMFIIQKEHRKNPDLALEILKEAQSAFPENYSFQKYEVDMLILANKKREALDLLDVLSKKYPKNMALLLNKALLSDEEFKQRKSSLDSSQYSLELEQIATDYKAVLSLVPKHPLANFNMAVLYSDQSNFLIQEINNMSAASQAASFEAYKEAANNALRKAATYMEAAKATQPRNVNILNALKLFYDKLEMAEESQAIQRELDALKG